MIFDDDSLQRFLGWVLFWVKSYNLVAVLNFLNTINEVMWPLDCLVYIPAHSPIVFLTQTMWNHFHLPLRLISSFYLILVILHLISSQPLVFTLVLSPDFTPNTTPNLPNLLKIIYPSFSPSIFTMLFIFLPLTRLIQLFKLPNSSLPLSTTLSVLRQFTNISKRLVSSLQSSRTSFVSPSSI